MFNVGSTEVILVFIVALIVIGPEKLPGAVKTAGLWIGRFRRSFYKVKADIERELNTDEIRRQLHNESVLAEIEEAKQDVESVAQDAEKSIGKIVNSQNFDPGLGQEIQAAKEATEEITKELSGDSLKNESATNSDTSDNDDGGSTSRSESSDDPQNESVERTKIPDSKSNKTTPA